MVKWGKFDGAGMAPSVPGKPLPCGRGAQFALPCGVGQRRVRPNVVPLFGVDNFFDAGTRVISDAEPTRLTDFWQHRVAAF